jgi:hypothetical protein
MSESLNKHDWPDIGGPMVNRRIWICTEDTDVLSFLRVPRTEVPENQPVQ